MSTSGESETAIGYGKAHKDKTVMFADIIDATEDQGKLLNLAENWNVGQRIIIG